MSEETPPRTPGSGDGRAATVTNPGLTIPPDRLAGNPRCLNCGTALQGPYCHHCGQPDRNLIRFFPALVRDMMEDFFDFDSRFVRTMKPLLFRPGALTRNFLEGRRYRYTPPMRLYLFSSLLFFLLASLASNAVDIRMDGEDVTPGDAPASVQIETNRDGEEPASGSDDTGSDPVGDGITVGDEPWDPVTNRVELPFAPRWLDDWINREIGEAPEKAKRIKENPRLIVDQFFEVLPISMFILLPVTALLYQFWYLFSGHFYIEHLIFALHNQSFAFVIMIAILVLGQFEEAFADAGGPLANATQIGQAILTAWIPLYFLFALRHVYQQGWWMTIVKFFAISGSYFFLLLVTTTLVGAAAFVML